MTDDSHILYRSRQIRAGMPKSDPVREAADAPLAWADRIKASTVALAIAFVCALVFTIFMTTHH